MSSGPDCTVHGRRGWLTFSCFKKCMCGDILSALLQKYHYSSNACAVPPVQHNIVLNYYICMHVQVGAFSLGCLFKALNELVSFS